MNYTFGKRTQQPNHITVDVPSALRTVNDDYVTNYYIAGNNVGVTVSPTYMTKDKQRKSYYWFLTLFIKKRISNPNLSNISPKFDILNTPISA